MLSRPHDYQSARSNEMLAALNVRDRALMDVWRIDLSMGAAVLEVENPSDVAWWLADDKLVGRCGFGWTPQGGSEISVRGMVASRCSRIGIEGSGAPLLPCHTTGHAGAHPAVRELEVSGQVWAPHSVVVASIETELHERTTDTRWNVHHVVWNAGFLYALAFERSFRRLRVART